MRKFFDKRSDFVDYRECCFSRRQSFARAFKDRTGKSVTEFMEECQELAKEE